MKFCIFSFNRGLFLKSCIDSIEQCVDSPDITVFDDNSYDQSTIEVLDLLRKKYTIHQPSIQSTEKLGGLYSNMQFALDTYSDASLLCFLQDDMQVVRPIEKDEIRQIEKNFDENAKLAFIHPCFLKGSAVGRYERSLVYREQEGLYFREGQRRSAGSYFAAVSIINPARLKLSDWKFGRSEPVNNAVASQIFDHLAQLRNPFAMWLPEVPAYRGSKKTIALKFAERIRKVGYYPYHILTTQENDDFTQRLPKHLPIAEEYLTLQREGPSKPWEYSPFQNRSFLKKMNSLELAVRKII